MVYLRLFLWRFSFVCHCLQLEVGNLPSLEENRGMLGAWIITSSPLILSFDIRDHDKMDLIWDLITNKEAVSEHVPNLSPAHCCVPLTRLPLINSGLATPED